MKAPFNQKLKAYFKDTQRSPIIGKFVCLKDYEDLNKKGMARFVSEAKSELFESSDNHVMHTKIFVLSDFSSFKIV